MTDTEIIKALKIHANRGDCGECAYGELPSCNCQMQMFKDCLDLINRQKAEIESRKKDCDELYEQMSERLKAEKAIERRLAKAEAIKEFAERLKKEALIDSGYEVLQLGTIDNLVKEMGGDTE